MTATTPLSPLSGYHLIEKLGEDPSGEVWKAEKGGQIYAVKLLNPGWESAVFEAFESRKGLGHPNLVKELEIGTYNGRPCLVMEYPDGQPLKKAGPLSTGRRNRKGSSASWQALWITFISRASYIKA